MFSFACVIVQDFSCELIGVLDFGVVLKILPAVNHPPVEEVLYFLKRDFPDFRGCDKPCVHGEHDRKVVEHRNFHEGGDDSVSDADVSLKKLEIRLQIAFELGRRFERAQHTGVMRGGIAQAAD